MFPTNIIFSKKIIFKIYLGVQTMSDNHKIATAADLPSS